jgi:glutathione S-transferase
MAKPTLYGFDGSTYVRTVRTLLAEKSVDYEQVPVNVLEGEPELPEHLERHPFGKVPVFDHDGLRIIETGAICRYIDDVFPGESFIPDNAVDRARMDMVLGIIDSYGYNALVMVAGYHLFPDFIGGKNEEVHAASKEKSRLVLTELMKIRGDSPYLAGDKPTLADFYLAPICFYVSLTDDAGALFSVDGFDDWWQRMQEVSSYRETEPDLGG